MQMKLSLSVKVRGLLYAVVTALAVSTLGFATGGVASASEVSSPVGIQASTQQGRQQAGVPDIHVSRLANGDTRVIIDGHTFTVRRTATTATVIDSTGRSTTVNAEGLPTAPSAPYNMNAEAIQGLSAVAVNGSAATAAKKGSLTCSFILMAVGIIHTGGWMAAIAVIAAAGPAGAAVLATMYMLGSAAFLTWAGTHC